MAARGTILLVDDSQDDIDLLLRTFKQVGVGNHIEVCRTADETEQYLQTHDLPSVMLLDLKMPAKDGFYVLRKVKTSPLLLTKPFDLAEFREMINAFHQYWFIHAKPAPPAGRVIPKPSETA